MAVQLTIPEKPKVLNRQDTLAFFKAFKKGDGQKALEDVCTKIAVKTHPDLTYNETKKALATIEAKSADWGNFGVETNSDVSREPLKTTLSLPKSIGVPPSAKVIGFIGLAADGFLGFATTMGALSAATYRYEFKEAASKFVQSLDLDQSVASIAGTAYSYAIPLGVLIAGGYGVYKIAKNIISDWKAEKVQDLQRIACAIEAAAEAVLSQRG